MSLKRTLQKMNGLKGTHVAMLFRELERNNTNAQHLYPPALAVVEIAKPALRPLPPARRLGRQGRAQPLPTEFPLCWVPIKAALSNGTLPWQPPSALATSTIHLATMGWALALGKLPSTSTDEFVWDLFCLFSRGQD